MDTHTLLVRALEREPEDDTCAEALGQYLEEERSVPAPLARAQVEQIRARVRDARYLALAAVLMQAGTRSARVLTRHIRQYVGLTPSNAATLLVIPGTQPPVWTRHGGHEWWSGVVTSTITVGGHWVVTEWDTLEAVRLRDRRHAALRRRHQQQ